jgi:ankyrin repeat protein
MKIENLSLPTEILSALSYTDIAELSDEIIEDMMKRANPTDTLAEISQNDIKIYRGILEKEKKSSAPLLLPDDEVIRIMELRGIRLSKEDKTAISKYRYDLALNMFLENDSLPVISEQQNVEPEQQGDWELKEVSEFEIVNNMPTSDQPYVDSSILLSRLSKEEVIWLMYQVHPETNFSKIDDKDLVEFCSTFPKNTARDLLFVLSCTSKDLIMQEYTNVISRSMIDENVETANQKFEPLLNSKPESLVERPLPQYIEDELLTLWTTFQNKPKSIQDNGLSDLILAIREHAPLPKIQALLEEIKDVNAKDSTGNTPLLWATYDKSSFEVIQALLKHGARSDIRAGVNEETPLTWAVRLGASSKIIQILLENNIKPDILGTNPFNHTALIWAIKNWGEIKKEAQANDKNVKIPEGGNDDIDPISAIRENENDSFKVIQLLLEKADVNAPGGNGNTPLIWAIENNASLEVMKLLCSKGAKVNISGKYDLTPLTCAIEIRASLEVIQFLFDNGAKANIQGLNFPLHYALKKCPSIKLIQLLLDNGAKADINTPDQFDRVPLIRAIEHNASLEIFQLLLNNGANVNVVGINNALGCAIRNNIPLDIVRVLLAAGAEVKLVPKHLLEKAINELNLSKKPQDPEIERIRKTFLAQYSEVSASWTGFQSFDNKEIMQRISSSNRLD